MAIALGKAFFWDMQVGSDGVQACASCHFRAGADPRSINQLNPGGANNADPTIDLGGPNYRLKASDFSLHKLADPTDRHSRVLRDSDDVVSSQGVHLQRFVSAERGAIKVSESKRLCFYAPYAILPEPRNEASCEPPLHSCCSVISCSCIRFAPIA